MPIQRPSLSKALLQKELNRFYAHPVARVSFGLILTILAVMFFALVAIKPTLETMGDLIKQIEEKQAVDRQLSQKITALSAAQSELAAKEVAAGVITKAVPTTPEFTRFVTIIERIASDHNVSFTSMVISTVPVERDTTHDGIEIESIPFTAGFSGGYPDLLATLIDLEKMQRLIVVDRVDMVPTADTDSSVITFSVAGRAFAFGKDIPLKK